MGGTGMLGHKLVQQLSDRFEVYQTIRTSFDSIQRYGFFRRERTIEGVDVENSADLVRSFEKCRPDVVINAVGIVKQLPAAENVINTLTVNSILPHRLYQLSFEFGFRLILISTDCVFLGNTGNYTEDDPADALDLYGRSKNLGEVVGERCLTIRSSIIGRELIDIHGLLEWFLSNRDGTVNGFSRAIYSGFPTIEFADIIAELLTNYPELNGLFHISSDPIDKFRLLKLINEAFGTGTNIIPDESFVIDRSLNSDKFKKITGFVPKSWEEMIDRMSADSTQYDKWRK